uniref:Pectinesterase n=1 Tax=Kalanchoe fedtschenkoi TaxID=63787 RepID=A0A7N0TLX4_KALFE
MAENHFNLFSILLFTASVHFVLATGFSSTSSAAPLVPASASSVCKSTPDPTYCKSILPNTRNGNVYSYGRFSVRKAISQARKFYALINKYLSKKSKLSLPAVRALEDCRFLAGLNLDFLSSSFRTVNSSANATLPETEADDVQTLLSAILTNIQTCYDGINSTASAWQIKNGIAMPLKNDTKLFSVSLALFTKGWVPKRMRGKKRGAAKHRKAPNIIASDGTLSVKMSTRNKMLYRATWNRNLRRTRQQQKMNRKLLQTDGGDGELLVSDMVVVSLDGTGNFTTINDAINIAPNKSLGQDGYFLIYVTAGVYEEYVSIPMNKRYLMMIGDGINQTIITGNHSVVDGWTTFNSATFAVVSLNFIMVGITIRNTAGAAKHQAVALRNGADLSTFYMCSFEGYQDTLYAHSLRQYYRECDVYGTVDFIFGNAAVVLQDCNLYPRRPMPGQFNAITAQGRTDPNQNTGTTIHSCTIRAADDLASSNKTVKTYLGRPWKEYSRTVYMQSYMDDKLIDPTGWSKWDGDFALNTSYYAEFNNSGPGSNTTRRVTWPGYHVIRNATDVANFTVSAFLLGDDWLPQTGVPYDGGLL